MLRFLPVLLLLGIVLELASLIWVGSRLGVVVTLLLLGAGAVAGVSLIRASGLDFADAMRGSELRGQFATVKAGIVLVRVAAGILFIVPGFFSDAVAVLLLMPPVSRWLKNRLAAAVKTDFTPRHGPGSPGSIVIDGEAIEISGGVTGPSNDRN